MPTMAGQLQQGWPFAQQTAGLNEAYAIGRLLVANEQQDESIISEATEWLSEHQVNIESQSLGEMYAELLQQRYFSI